MTKENFLEMAAHAINDGQYEYGAMLISAANQI